MEVGACRLPQDLRAYNQEWVTCTDWFSIFVTPVARDRIDQKATVVGLIHRVAELLKLRPVLPHELMSSAMCERGTVTRKILWHVEDALTASEENEQCHLGSVRRRMSTRRRFQAPHRPRMRGQRRPRGPKN